MVKLRRRPRLGIAGSGSRATAFSGYGDHSGSSFGGGGWGDRSAARVAGVAAAEAVAGAVVDVSAVAVPRRRRPQVSEMRHPERGLIDEP